MTRNRKTSKIKIISTGLFLVLFVITIVFADRFTSSANDMQYVNPAFVGDSRNDVAINMNAMSVDFNEWDDTAVVYYIVQEGDTLESIAKEFGTTVSNLKKVNSVKTIKAGQKIIVTDEENGLLYQVREAQNIKVFANKYWLNLEDLMTLNYIQDDTEVLYSGQEIFINISEQAANTIPGFIDKAQPDLSPVVVKTPTKTTTTTTKTTTTTTKTTSSSTSTATTTTTATAAASSSKKVLSRWTFNQNINNGFYRGYCTWYVATQMPSIFPYDETGTKQTRPFGGNAKDWYANAKEAGYSVGQTPKVGSIIVYNPLRSSAGHVGIVRGYDASTGELTIEDMNYESKFVVTKRIDSASNSKIIGYIYP